MSDLITTPGLINLDFADVKSVMQGAGSALMGIGSARGEDRAVQAAELAISSPLLEASIDGAYGVLLSIQGGSDLGLFEINEAARLVQEAAHPEANIIFGSVIDDALGDEVRVTVIAAGFDGGDPQPRREEPAQRPAQQPAQQQTQQRPAPQPVQQQRPVQQPVQQRPAPQQPQRAQGQQPQQPQQSQQQGQPSQQQAQPVQQQGQPQQPQQGTPGQVRPAEQQQGEQQPQQRPPRQVTYDDAADLDVPDFLK